MKLTFPQKIAITLSLLWVLFIFYYSVQSGASFMNFVVYGGGPAAFLLWISGSLKPLIQRFKGAEQ